MTLLIFHFSFSRAAIIFSNLNVNQQSMLWLIEIEILQDDVRLLSYFQIANSHVIEMQKKYVKLLFFDNYIYFRSLSSIKVLPFPGHFGSVVMMLSQCYL